MEDVRVPLCMCRNPNRFAISPRFSDGDAEPLHFTLPVGDSFLKILPAVLPVLSVCPEWIGTMHRKAFKFRLYPTPAQETILRQTLETCRGVYNSLLNERKHDYEVVGKSPSCAAQQKHLPLWKQDHPELSGVFSQVLQDVAKRIDKAFEAFFRRVKSGEEPGYPRFKGKGQYKSITYPQKGFGIGENSVILSKIGTLKAVLHRPVEGTVKTCTVARQGEKWFVTFSCEILHAEVKHLGCPEGASC
ncbi:MAG: transposase [Chthonomonadaceae bacterium]|nr:transposase [Chthonomonadaceae bacterium]